MDIEKLIESVRLCGSTPKVDQCKRCAYWAAGDMSRCIPNMTGDAATALSTLQAEKEKLMVRNTKLEDTIRSQRNGLQELRAELENYRKGHCSEGGCAAERDRDLVIAENEKLRAELEQVKRENNAFWTYIEIIDREYRRYMDLGYIDRLDELKKVWRSHGQGGRA